MEGTEETNELVKVVLVPIEVFGADDGYGLSDCTGAQSDCNRARGRIYRRLEEDSIPYWEPEDVIVVYVPREELHKFDKHFGDEFCS